MAVNARVNIGGSVGQIKLTQSVRSTIVVQNFAPKPNVSLNEINDVSIVGVKK